MEGTLTSPFLSLMIMSLSGAASVGLWSVIDFQRLHLGLCFASKPVTRQYYLLGVERHG